MACKNSRKCPRPSGTHGVFVNTWKNIFEAWGTDFVWLVEIQEMWSKAAQGQKKFKTVIKDRKKVLHPHQALNPGPWVCEPNTVPQDHGTLLKTVVLIHSFKLSIFSKT